MKTAPALVSIPEISEAALRHAEVHREAFVHADPFKHVMIDNFFEQSFAERLLAEFPKFSRQFVTNELGMEGRKAVNTNIREISPAYQELYRLIASPQFLDFVGRLSGIPGLVFDPKMYGGGTHDNQHGQELDPHVDFNYDESQQLHRRLNLIVYLNKDWQSEWGGALEIHSNPREPRENRIRSYDPLFNRCVMFETNEHSWHGFPKINLPENQRHLSRKSISIYLYTKDRPAEEIVPMHGTFYVQRPLPKQVAAGHTLTEQDVADLEWLLTVRDGWIRSYQRMELEKNREIADKAHWIRDLQHHVRAPLTGYILQEGPAAGFYADGWVASHAEIQIRPLLPVSGLLLRGYRPESSAPGRLRLTINDAAVAQSPVESGVFEINVSLPQPVHETFHVKFVFGIPNRDAPSGIDRDLAFVLVELRGRHPDTGLLAEMQQDLSRQLANARARIGELEVQAEAAGRLAAELEDKCRELAQAVDHLHAAERTIEERTNWAQGKTAEVDELHRQLNALLTTRWARLGRKLRLLADGSEN